jgi:hypothetical protein
VIADKPGPVFVTDAKLGDRTGDDVAPHPAAGGKPGGPRSKAMTLSDAVPAADVAAKLTPVVLDVSDDKRSCDVGPSCPLSTPSSTTRRTEATAPRGAPVALPTSELQSSSTRLRTGSVPPCWGPGWSFSRRGAVSTMTEPQVGVSAIPCRVSRRLVCDQGCDSGKSWDARSLVLDDGDVLHWVIEVVPGVEPSVVYYRTDRTGSLPAVAGARLLRQHGHPDAGLAQPANHPRPVRRLSCGPAPGLNLAPNG